MPTTTEPKRPGRPQGLQTRKLQRNALQVVVLLDSWGILHSDRIAHAYQPIRMEHDPPRGTALMPGQRLDGRNDLSRVQTTGHICPSCALERGHPSPRDRYSLRCGSSCPYEVRTLCTYPRDLTGAKYGTDTTCIAFRIRREIQDATRPSSSSTNDWPRSRPPSAIELAPLQLPWQ